MRGVFIREVPERNRVLEKIYFCKRLVFFKKNDIKCTSVYGKPANDRKYLLIHFFVCLIRGLGQYEYQACNVTIIVH